MRPEYAFLFWSFIWLLCALVSVVLYARLSAERWSWLRSENKRVEIEIFLTEQNVVIALILLVAPLTFVFFTFKAICWWILSRDVNRKPYVGDSLNHDLS